MEQKKILWILFAVSGFIVLVFGFALIRFTPSKTREPAFRPAVAMTQAPLNANQNRTDVAPSATDAAQTPAGAADAQEAPAGIDPDKWVRDPEQAPGLHTNIPPASNINLTIVNGDNAAATYGTLDVRGLTRTQADVAQGNEAAGQSSQDTSVQTPQNVVSADADKALAGQAAASDSVAAQKSVSSTASKPAPEKKIVSTQSKPAKAAPAKTKTPVAVTEYWIQTGSFASKLNAEKARESLTKRALKAEIFTKEVSGATNYRVRVGPYTAKSEADYWLGTIKDVAEFKGSYISEVKTKK